MFPEIGSPVEDTDHPGLREQIVDNHRIIYRYDGVEVCQVVGVVHGSADLDQFLDLMDAL
jgi:plasmid stabilization system protein ParE